MLELIKPTLEQLSFKQELLSDEKTMSFNHKYGGTMILIKIDGIYGMTNG